MPERKPRVELALMRPAKTDRHAGEQRETRFDMRADRNIHPATPDIVERDPLRNQLCAPLPAPISDFGPRLVHTKYSPLFLAAAPRQSYTNGVYVN